jgi:hypothetical protein
MQGAHKAPVRTEAEAGTFFMHGKNFSVDEGEVADGSRLTPMAATRAAASGPRASNYQGGV